MFSKTILATTFKASILKVVPPYRALYKFSTGKSQSELKEVVEGKVFEILRSAAKCDQSKLNKNATFEQLGFDSLDSVELVVAME